MRAKPLILVVDDNEANVDILETRLLSQGFEVIAARDGEAALAAAREALPDLILLDVMMPGLDGFEVARRLKGDASLPFIPIIHVTAKARTEDIVQGLDAGADDYLTKPFDHAALVARVRAMLRIKALNDQVREQAARLGEQARLLADWNSNLEARVAAQVGELERLARLKRFLSPQVADVILASGEGETLLQSHRREITVVFCDLRGFTAFSEIAEPEEVMGVLAAYHRVAGQLIERFEATLERFAGDGLMLFFNDPLPCPDPAERAVRFTLALCEGLEPLIADWRARGHQLGCGLGIAQGYATLGRIGYAGRSDYGAVGPVVNQASRLCDLAKAGEILISQRVANAVAAIATTEPLGEIALSGLRQAVQGHRLIGLK